MKTITITLDEYEVANIRELIRCCGYAREQVKDPPFRYNTGDWLGQLFWKLEPLQTENQPNVSIDQVRAYKAQEERALIERVLNRPEVAGRPDPARNEASGETGKNT